MTEQELTGLLMTISFLIVLTNMTHICNYIDDCVDGYKKNRKNKQAH
jgi:hypothetical protein